LTSPERRGEAKVSQISPPQALQHSDSRIPSPAAKHHQYVVCVLTRGSEEGAMRRV
jgi:hypothetical protein